MSVNEKKPIVFTDNTLPVINKTKIRLNNGLSIFFIEGREEELLRLEFLFYAGSYYQAKKLTAALTASLIKEGTHTRNSGKISEALDYYGVYANFEPQKDLVSITVFVLEDYLEPVLEIIEDVIKNPSFPEHEIEITLNNIKQKFIVEQQKVMSIARMNFGKYLFGEGHPYGRILSVSDFDNLARADLVEFHKKHYVADNSFCIVSGILNDNIIDLFQKHFGNNDWLGGSVIAKKDKKTEYPKPDRHFIYKENALQSAVRIGKICPGITHPDYHKLMITNTILGGYFGSRLMKKIRQEKAYTYGINSAIVSLLNESYFFISSQIGVDFVDKAIDDIYMEIKKIRTQHVDKEELTVVKNYLYGSFLRSFDGIINQAERIKELIFYDLNENHFENYLNTLNSITVEDISLMAEKYLNENHMSQLVVGKQ
ncbi:MAG: pitrilysin family protein [Bacteroidales bacterium]